MELSTSHAHVDLFLGFNLKFLTSIPHLLHPVPEGDIVALLYLNSPDMTVSVAMLSTNINNLPQEIVTKQKANLHNITPISSLPETADAILFLVLRAGSGHEQSARLIQINKEKMFDS